MTDEQTTTDLSIERIVLRDLSFETPMGQDVYSGDWQPEYKVRLDLRRTRLSDTLWEVIITATITAKLDDSIAFVIEVQQAGVFQVARLEREPLRRVLAIEAPKFIFPYLRETVDNVAAKGLFPAVNLQPPDFKAWYEEANQSGTASDSDP